MKETDNDDEADVIESSSAPVKNYMTPSSFAALQAELKHLQREERPKVVEIVAWAAGNGDRSENGDYIYGKKRLREIDRRLRYLGKALRTAELVDPKRQQGLDKVFFGATVTYATSDGTKHRVTLVGLDEADLKQSKISWISPIAKALIKSQVGDVVEFRTPSGSETLEVLHIKYKLD